MRESNIWDMIISKMKIALGIVVRLRSQLFFTFKGNIRCILV